MYRFFIRGVVQGVGFRPFIYNSCVKNNLNGFVQNTGSGVIVDVDDKEKFLEIIKDIPPLARIDSCSYEKNDLAYSGFKIIDSTGKGFAEIPPDLFLCVDCLHELNDPSDRRCNYFFITCTNCGPRFSIAKGSPYDRDTTTMDIFPMCDRCKEEYVSPGNRRYHAQTIACHECGPKLSLFIKGEQVQDAIKGAAALINDNKVIAIKGVGGFHLACNTRSSIKLRKLTGRPDKPYAVMCRDIDMVKTIAFFDELDKELLLSGERPIVVLKKKILLNDVSELDTIGVMLPYTALHYLLFDYINEPLVMTSSNIPDEPITINDTEQITEDILTHDRKIENNIDDSVMKNISGKPVFLRRSRGFVPGSIRLEFESDKQVLALGAELSNTFCIYKNKRAILSQYMGTTSNLLTFEHYKKMIKKFMEFTQLTPDAIIADLHPMFNTSLYAEELSKIIGAPLIRVQHHKAHAYSAAAEHNLKDFAAVVCDGLGYGEDETIWGGEVFDNGKRIGHLDPQLQLGGDLAAMYPERMLYSILRRFMSPKEVKRFVNFTEQEIQILERQLHFKFNCPITTSCGRIFDAASALLGFCSRRTYEGRPAMLLEAKSTEPFTIEPVIKDNILMTTPLFEFLVKNIDKDKNRLAATVQYYVADGLYRIASELHKPIVFSGGCAYNQIMASFMLSKGALINEKVPCGDGGISFGQIGYYLKNKIGSS